MPLIRFSKNWNGKLDSKNGTFTTIRKNPDYYKKFLSKEYTVMFLGKEYCRAFLMEHQKFDSYLDIDKNIIEDDTGLPYAEAVKVLHKFIGTNPCCLLTFWRSVI